MLTSLQDAVALGNYQTLSSSIYMYWLVPAALITMAYTPDMHLLMVLEAETQEQGAGSAGFWKGLSSWLAGHRLVMFSLSLREQSLLMYKGTNLIGGGPHPYDCLCAACISKYSVPILEDAVWDGDVAWWWNSASN